MKSKNIVSIVLLLFVAMSLAYLVVSESRPVPDAEGNVPAAGATATATTGAGAESVTAAPDERQMKHRLIAYYFHRNQRCKTCLTIEEYAHEALTESFPEQLDSGELEWRVVNYEEPKNEHFTQDYELVTSSLVLVQIRDGQQTEWQALDEVWGLLGDKPAFQEFVKGKAAAYLGDGS